MKLLAPFTALFIASVIAQSAIAADTFRCGAKSFQAGMRVGVTQVEVATHCGPPVARKGDRWFYMPRGGFASVLVFDSAGKLVAIHKRKH